MKKQYFFVGVYLETKILFGILGLTNYVFGYAEAETAAEAGKIAKAHFEKKCKVAVTATRPQLVKRSDFFAYADPNDLIKPCIPMQQTTFETL